MLRKINLYIDFSFIDEKVRPLYCQNNGRPAIDPTLLFKMIFLGYFYGIRSERQLEREVQTNLAPLVFGTWTDGQGSRPFLI